jgi:hypothetical protein
MGQANTALVCPEVVASLLARVPYLGLFFLYTNFHHLSKDTLKFRLDKAPFFV